MKYLYQPLHPRLRLLCADRTAWNPTMRTIAGVKQRRGSRSIRVALGIALESTIIVRNQEALPASRSRQTLPWREGPTSLGAVSIIWWRIEIEGSAGCLEHSRNLERTDAYWSLFRVAPPWLASRSQVLGRKSEIWKLVKGRSHIVSLDSRSLELYPWNSEM